MNTPYNFKTMITIGSATFALLAAPLAVTAVTGFDLGMISAAHAADDGSSSSKKGSGHKGKAGSQKGAQGKGDSASKKIFRVPESSEDSDRPVWAGVKGGKSGGGGKPAGAGSKKGDLFGDMVVLLRDANGVPILVNGLVQVVAYVYDTNGNLVPLKDASGNLVAIPYNAEGDLETSINGVPVYSAEVDLGRLSVGRAPTKVLTHSLDEALSKLTSGTVALDSTGRLTVNGVTIDSPLENLALYEAYMTKTLPTAVMDVLNNPALKFNPASLLAAASDKYGSISVDTVVYMNSILGINTGTTYYDFSTTNYDRYTTWKNATATVLVLQPNGSYLPTVVNLYDAVFNNTNWVDPTPSGGADDFAAAADDYRAVIEFVHDNAVR
jgi:hypothetical protein